MSPFARRYNASSTARRPASRDGRHAELRGKASMAFRILCITIACAAAWLLSGCGQYGPLYLPGNVPASQRPPHSASHPAPAAPASASSVAPAAP